MKRENHPLVGRELVGFKLAPDGSEITFALNDGRVRLVAEGDCCSSSWIESIDNPEALQGKVLAVEDIDMPDLGNIPGERRNPKYGVDQVSYYGLKITTENGSAVLDYRNDSNGYYGGSLELRED